MPNNIHNIAKNTSYFTFALIVQKVLSFTYFAILARNLAPDNLGKYYFAISFTTIFAIFVDFGIINILVREVAKNPKEANKYLSNSLVLRIPLAVVSAIIAIFIINSSGEVDALTRVLVYLSIICMLLDSFTMNFFAIARGFHNLKYESLSSVLFQLVVLSFGLSFLKLGMSMVWLMGALVIASVFNFIYSLSLIKLKWKLKFFSEISFSFIKNIVTIAVPFAVFGILQRFYLYLDSVLLKFLAGDEQVGLYQISFKIIFALQFLPMAFTASLYPAFSSYWKNNRQKLPVSFERAINYLVVISVPISVGIASLADKIILIFRPEYAAAVFPLRVIIFSLVFIFINFPIGSLLNAADRQKINTFNMAVVLSLSIIMNIILIPEYKALGAAVTVLVTNIVMFILGSVHVPRLIKYRPLRNIAVFLKALLAAFVMAVVVIKLKYEISIIVNILLGGLIYFGMLYSLGGVKKEDLKSIIKSFKK